MKGNYLKFLGSSNADVLNTIKNPLSLVYLLIESMV